MNIEAPGGLDQNVSADTLDSLGALIHQPVTKANDENDHRHFNRHGQHAYRRPDGPVQHVGDDQLIDHWVAPLVSWRPSRSIRHRRACSAPKFSAGMEVLKVAFSMVMVTS